MFTNPNTMLFSENPRNTKILQSVYQWFNLDNGSIILDNDTNPKVFWIEKTWSQADFPSQKVFAKIKQLMKKHYHVEYLYEKYP